MKRFFYYFGSTVVLGFIIYGGATYQLFLKQEFKDNFEPINYLLFSSLFPVAIGMLLRLPKLVSEIKQNKEWTFDSIKFCAIGLPSLVILSMYLLLFSPMGESILPVVPYLIYVGDSTLITIAGVVFGFILLDSLKK